MSTGYKFYVQVDRSDGSRTYKGAWDEAHCQREADAWADSFPDYVVQLVPASDPTVRKDVAAWSKATRADGAGPYFPPVVAS